LVYATCSLSSVENEDVVSAFLAEHHDFRPEEFARDFGAVRRGAAGLLFLPSRHDTDGFFVASMRRT
jgi:16S rRNA (cytosine967-C5)-methyltransferase